MIEVINEIIATIISGIILTLILFLINEYLLPKKNITGEWITEIAIKNSAYNPYKDLKINYKIYLLQKGNEIIGSGEKTSDILANGDKKEFTGEERVKIVLEGYYERNYLKKSKVFLKITEFGSKRESRAIYFLTVKNKNKLKGNFTSTAADSSGLILMKKI